MEKFIIEGKRPLHGKVTISGSKNATLPILASSLLTDEPCTFHNVPDIADIHTLLTLFTILGVKTSFEKNTVKIHAEKIKPIFLDHGLVGKMRASALLAGPLLARSQEVDMAFPGGCVLGKRSLSVHTYALKRLNCDILDETKNFRVKTKKLKGGCIVMPEMSVTATENAVMAATLAEGETEIRLAACEPHVQDLCHCLNKMGAKIRGIGTHHLIIEGVKKLKGVEYTITGDYLETGTFAIAAAATQGEVMLDGIQTRYLDSFWQKLEETGAKFELHNDKVQFFPTKKLNAIKMLRTAVYPSFPTDLQAPFTVLLTQANGVSKIFETLFEGRLNHLFELEKMGAHVEFLNPHQAIIIGPTTLKGIPIASCDIRAGAAMVVAALIAEGKTEISNIKYIDRGYENLDGKLRVLGAEIERINDENVPEKHEPRFHRTVDPPGRADQSEKVETQTTEDV